MMNLGERQAYETGRKDGWQEAIVAMASGAKKLLGAEVVRTLAAALTAGLDAGRRVEPSEGDPTEPASWACPDCRHRAHLPGPCLNMASDHGCSCGVGTRPGDEDRHTVGEHR